MEMGGWIEVEGVWMRTTWISSQRKERVKTALSSLVLGVEESELLQCKDHYNVIFRPLQSHLYLPWYLVQSLKQSFRYMFAERRHEC